jgi:quinoprotein glucose dehydrogenase
MFFVNTNNLPSYNVIVPDDGKSMRAAGGYQVDRAYIKLTDQNGMPCIRPPWGEMIAIDGNTGDIAWRRPLGNAEMYGEAGAQTGLINRGSSLATAGGLVFMGGTPDQPLLHAFESRTGREVWTVRLASAVNSAPMSFVGRNGRQYLVVGISGRADAEISLIAFALPRPGDPRIDLHPAPLATARAGVPQGATGDLPPGTGRDDVMTVCTACHAIGTVTAQRRSAAEWQSLVAEMRGRGAKMDDAARTRILGYLNAHLGSTDALKEQ